MKKTTALFAAIMTLSCIVTAVGCGTVNETTRMTTHASTTMQSTTQTTKETTEKSTQTTKRPETETTEITDTLIDPMLPLPDIDDPIIDIEPNIPDSGTTDNGTLGDIFENNDITNDIDNNMKSRKRDADSREKHHKSNRSDSMTPVK